MPFINSKISVPVSAEKRDALRAELGRAVSILGKPESYLMLGFEDNYDLSFAGRKLERGAFVSVQSFGEPSPDACGRMTARICDILKKELDIPGEGVYVTYQGIRDWGWNGSNF